MGAKTAVKLRNRGFAYKCDLCGRKLMTPDALVAHQRTAHNVITRRTKPKQEIKPVRSSKVEVKVKPVKKALPSIRNTPKLSENKVKEAPKSEPNKNDEGTETRKKTVEFECPKCFRVFLTYFPAHKHIQKYHCVNRQGSKVAPNSPSLIQPVRVELCLKCNKKVKSIQTHVCDKATKDKIENQEFLCIACDLWFPNIKSIDLHVLSLHGNEAESMFFPTNTEFTKWKTEMEAQMKVSYAILDNYESKKYYHCNFVKENPEKNNARYLCPSTIVIQEYSKGIQVHFYKQHYKHDSVDYTLTDKYKKYSITSFLKRSEEYNNFPALDSDDNDMYLQFKTLMEGIVMDAAKINIATLKILIGKALDMTSILTNYDEEVDDSNATDVHNASQTMNDSQISKALEENNLSTGKRKNNNRINIDSKKIKLELMEEHISDTSSPKILNSFSLADSESVKNKLNKENCKLKDNKNNKNKSNSLVKVLTQPDLDQTPSSFNDSYKDFVVKNFPHKDNRKKMVRPVKTKIGQFKPSTSPKSPNNNNKSLNSSVAINNESRISNRLSVEKPKVDFKYEVKEQEEGCNILILKI